MSRHKQHKQKQREKRLRKERNLRRGQAATPGSSERAARSGTTYDNERVFRAAVRSGALEGASSIDELNTRIHSFAQSDVAGLARAALALGGVEAAQELAYQALEAESAPRSIALATKALELDPKCPDALVTLALRRAKRPVDALEGLEHAVSCAAERLGEDALRGDERSRLGGMLEARPYLRARSTLLTVLLGSDRRAESLDHSRDMLEFDPLDRRGVRREHLGVLLEYGRLDEARALLERFPDDDSGTFVWGAVLEQFLRSGPRACVEVLARARAEHPLFERVLYTDGLAPDEETRDTFQSLGRAWIVNRAAFEWLSSGAPQSTPEERNALCASFAPPVATLLTLGEPTITIHWIDYVAEHGFTLEHLPELVRMVGAPEFDELSGDDPRVWAPIHATRVLGQLRAAAAVEPLIDFARRHRDDEWNAIERCFELIGPPAVDALVRWLRRPAEIDLALMVPVDALSRIADSHPAERPRITAELAALLLHFERHSPALNSQLVETLFELDATAYRALVAGALTAEAIEEAYLDDLPGLRTWAGVGE